MYILCTYHNVCLCICIALSHNFALYSFNWLHIMCSRYGIGYHMVIEKAPSCNSIEVVNIVKSLVPGGKCVVDAGAELSLILPSQQTANFPPLFEKLECTYDIVYILSESVVYSTLYVGTCCPTHS